MRWVVGLVMLLGCYEHHLLEPDTSRPDTSRPDTSRPDAAVGLPDRPEPPPRGHPPLVFERPLTDGTFEYQIVDGLSAPRRIASTTVRAQIVNSDESLFLYNAPLNELRLVADGEVRWSRHVCGLGSFEQVRDAGEYVLVRCRGATQFLDRETGNLVFQDDNDLHRYVSVAPGLWFLNDHASYRHGFMRPSGELVELDPSEQVYIDLTGVVDGHVLARREDGVFASHSLTGSKHWGSHFDARLSLDAVVTVDVIDDDGGLRYERWSRRTDGRELMHTCPDANMALIRRHPPAISASGDRIGILCRTADYEGRWWWASTERAIETPALVPVGHSSDAHFAEEYLLTVVWSESGLRFDAQVIDPSGEIIAEYSREGDVVFLGASFAPR